jgi:hypothetical protein
MNEEEESIRRLEREKRSVTRPPAMFIAQPAGDSRGSGKGEW